MVKTLLKTIAFIFFLRMSSFAVAADFVVPVESIHHHPAGLTITYALPCGFNEVGVLVSSGSKPRIGVVLEPSEIHCARVPILKEQTLSSLAHLKITQTRSEDLRSDQLPTHVRRVPPEDLRVMNQQRRTRKQIELVYRGGCGDTVGYVVQEDSVRGQIHLAVAETSDDDDEDDDSDDGDQDCDDGQSIFRIPRLDVRENYQIEPLTNGSGSQDQFALRVAPVVVQFKSLSDDSKLQGLAVAYNRRCNEAPLGIVLAKTGSVKKIGMVVMVNRLWQCSDAEPDVKEIWTEPQLKEWDGSHSGLVSFDGFPRSEELDFLAVKPPIEYELQDNRLHLDYYAGCNDMIGVVYHHDNTGRLSIGVLERSESAKPCSKPAVERSIRQSFLRSTATQDSIFPLRIQ